MSHDVDLKKQQKRSLHHMSLSHIFSRHHMSNSSNGHAPFHYNLFLIFF